MPTLVVVPRWGGTGASDFYPWLFARAGALGFSRITVAELAPSPGAPEPQPTADSVRAALGDDDVVVILAHSVGCQGAIRALAAGPVRANVRGVLFVAGWFTIDAPWPAIEPWLRDPPDLSKARARCERFSLVVSDDDPFTRDHAATRAAFEGGLGAAATLVPGGKHFNGAEEPAVLDALALVSRAALP